MNFEFVDESARANNAGVRRQIRRHAARGHNAGKTISRIKERPALRERPGDLLQNLVSRPKALTIRDKSQKNETPMILRRVGDDFGCLDDVPLTGTPCRRRVQQVISFLLRPAQVTKLIRVLAPNRPGGVTTAAMGLWVRLMFTDEACMHSTMATVIIALNNARLFQENISHAYHHFGIVLQSINKKLATSEAASDATMAAVIIATQYERYRNAYANGVAHLVGVHRMIAMRGGFAAVAAGNPTLGHKVLRADLEYSLHLGSPTKVTVDEMRTLFSSGLLVDASQSQNTPAAGESNLDLLLSLALSPALKFLFDDMKDLTRAINGADEGVRPKFDAVNLDNEIISFGYRLTSICPLGSLVSTNLVERLIHVGLAAIMATMLLGLDGKPLVLPLLQPTIDSIAKAVPRDAWDEDLRKIWLWVLFVCESAAVFEIDEQQAWVHQEVASLKESMELSNWKDAEAILLEFPWAKCLHESAGLALWNNAGTVGTWHPDMSPGPAS